MGQTASSSARTPAPVNPQNQLIRTVPLKSKRSQHQEKQQQQQPPQQRQQQIQRPLPTPVEWKEVFEPLTDNELLELILAAPVSEKDIQRMAQHIMERQTSEVEAESIENANGGGSAAGAPQVPPKSGGSSSVHSTTSSIDHETTFYVTSALQLSPGRNGGGAADKDEFLTELCFRILRISTTMAKLRFKLVPTKLKEHLFWQSLWTILYYEIMKQDHHQQQQDPTNNGNVDDVKQQPAAVPKQHTRQLTSSSSTYSYDNIDGSSVYTSSTIDDDKLFQDFQKEQVEKTIFKLRRTIERQQWKMDDMKEEIIKLKTEKLNHLMKQQPQQEDKATSTTATTTAKHQHPGRWIMDQDSIDFLKYPTELKQNLRDEKHKRLREVKAQMKFILDSDQIEDSNGHWDCCQSPQYASDCSCKKNRKQK